MEDRVAEILGERAALGNSAAAAVALSIVLHGALTFAGVVAALRSKTTQSVSVMNIQFAKVPAAAPIAPMTPAAPKVEAKPVPKLAEPTPEITKPAEAKPEPKTVPKSPFGQSTKRGSETPAATQQPSNPATATQAIPIGGTGVTIEGDFPYTIYIDRMKTLIGTHWLRPAVNGAAVTVYFIVERDGTIREVKPEVPSGNGTFDRAALRAVLESSPLPPLPFAYNGSWLGVHLTFK
jgi:TonB family protein